MDPLLVIVPRMLVLVQISWSSGRRLQIESTPATCDKSQRKPTQSETGKYCVIHFLACSFETTFAFRS